VAGARHEARSARGTSLRIRALWVLLAGALIAWLAPLLGLAASGREITPYLAFPPRTQPVTHAPADGLWFALLSLPVLGAAALFVVALARAQPQARGTRAARAYPFWGWLGLASMAAGWLAAWSELTPAEWRRYAFTPLWLGYVLAMDALVHRRAGGSLLAERPRWFAALFPASAAFWWLFEHLNQFVRNWHYAGIQASGDWDYFLQGSLPFSTVLPAVAVTWMWLRQFPRLEALRLPAVRAHPALAWAALLGGVLGLAAAGAWPEAWFPMLWLGPLLVFSSLQYLMVGETLFAPLARGDWRPLLQPALAALACGLLWEFWNYWSLAKWHYSIPHVQRFRLFEMPLLGYAGYLPFGVTCALVLDTLARLIDQRRLY
jgi:hypothetical protein